MKGKTEWLESVDSTNSEARRRIANLDNLSVIAAECQTSGRGQGDHKWHSRKAENLTFSFVVKYADIAPLFARDELLITEMTTAALRAYLLEKGINSRIKWHNDIWVGDLKICGILIENILEGNKVASSIIGIGLNVNQTSFPADLPNPTSMSLQTGKVYDLRMELENLHEQLCRHALMMGTDDGRKYLEGEFFAHMFRLDV